MSKQVWNYHCGQCSDGVVTATRTERGNRIDIKGGICNSCGHHYGLKTIQELQPVKKPKTLADGTISGERLWLTLQANGILQLQEDPSIDNPLFRIVSTARKNGVCRLQAEPLGHEDEWLVLQWTEEDTLPVSKDGCVQMEKMNGEEITIALMTYRNIYPD